MIRVKCYEHLVLITEFKHLLNGFAEAEEVVIDDTYNKE